MILELASRAAKIVAVFALMKAIVLACFLISYGAMIFAQAWWFVVPFMTVVHFLGFCLICSVLDRTPLP